MKKPPSQNLKNPENPQDTKSTLLQTVRPLISNLSILAAGLAVVAYFIGWRFLYFYYASFGLDSTFFSFSPIDVFSAGWRLYIIAGFLILSAIFILLSIQKMFNRNFKERNEKSIILIYLLFLIAAFGLACYVIYLFFFSFGAHSTLIFYVYAFVVLMLLWISFCIGRQIDTHILTRLNRTGFAAFFKIIFLNSSIWLVAISIAFVIVLAFFASYLGLGYRLRDTGPGSRLPIATLYTDQQVDIPNGKQIRPGVWEYDNLRYLFKTADFYFVFRIDDFDEQGLYIVPQKNLTFVQLRGWAYALSHPEILMTPTP